MLPEFYTENYTAKDVHSFDGGCEYSFCGVSKSSLTEYTELLGASGFSVLSENCIDGNYFAALTDGNIQVNLAYYPELTQTTYEYKTKKADGHTDYTLPTVKSVESDSVLKVVVGKFLSLPELGACECIMSPTLTQAKQMGIGMSYIIRLADGSFLIIDGGLGVEGSCEYHMDFLKSHKPAEHQKPRLRFIFTHAHPDHIGMTAKLLDAYSDELDVLGFYYNFIDEKTEYAQSFRDGGGATLERLLSAMKHSGAPCVTIHSGDVISLPFCTLCVLSTHEDLFPKPLGTLNTASTVFKLIFCDGERRRSVMFLGDTTEYNAIHINAAYSANTLKSDILQVAHHGENASAGTEQLRLLYGAICPETALYSNTEARVTEIDFCPNRALLGASAVYADNEQTVKIFD